MVTIEQVTGDLPTGDVFDKSDLESTFSRVVSSHLIGGHSVSFVVGRTWEKIHSDTSSYGFDGLKLVDFWSQKDSSSLNRMSIQVFSATLSVEISAPDRLKIFCQFMDYNVQKLEARGDSLADALINFQLNGVLFIGRLVVRYYGGDILVTIASDVAINYDQVSDILAVLVRFVSADDLEVYGPNLGRRLVLMGNNIAYEVPTGWTEEALIGNGAGVWVKDLLLSTSGTLLARLRVRQMISVPNISITAELEKILSEFEGAGLQFGAREVLGSNDFLATNPRFRMLRVDCFRAIVSGQSTKLRFERVVMSDERHVLIFGMLGTDAGQSMVLSSQSRRALQVAIQTLSNQ